MSDSVKISKSDNFTGALQLQLVIEGPVNCPKKVIFAHKKTINRPWGP
jgi:hypothetical protein